ncbi:MAG: WecB/TagA/CpsF family glycosyltransferase [Desulfobacterales bacterium]|nr:WecB/TagA/CpsF family glycosyltransferase [Desulfobacterales bacterium]
MITNYASILGVPIDNITTEDITEKIFGYMDSYKENPVPKYIATVNTDFIINTMSLMFNRVRHPELLNILRKSDIVTADGMPLLWASKLLNSPLKERITGSDLLPLLTEKCSHKKRSVYFLGGAKDSARRASEILEKKYPDLKIAGYTSPFITISGDALEDSLESDKKLVEKINKTRPDILFIGLGNPKQEIWFQRNKHLLKVPVSIGIGGSYDFITGDTKRAPKWMQKSGLEWLYRLKEDPFRLWKRYLNDFVRFGIQITPAIVQNLINRIKYKVYGKHYHVKITRRYDAVTNVINVYIKLPNPFYADDLIKIEKELKEKKGKKINFIFSFINVDFINSYAIGFLMNAFRKIEKSGNKIFIVDISKRIKNVMVVNHAWDYFTEYVCKDYPEVQSRSRNGKSTKSFKYSFDSKKDTVNVNMHGELDAKEMSKLKIDEIANNIGDKKCNFNLKKLRFIDSSGVILFIKLRKILSEKNRNFTISDMNRNVKQTFHTTKLFSLFNVVG